MGPILVTGGTGCLGSVVVSRLLDAGAEVRIASRRPKPAALALPVEWAIVDYRTGAGLPAAVQGADAIVHCAGSMRSPVDRNLVDAASHAGGPHLVYISIVGIDRVPNGYYRSKLAAERLIENSGLPYTILRATQFHDLIRLMLAALARSPVMPVPAVPVQPIEVSEVAARLAELATGPALGRAPDMGGPHVHSMPDLARTYLSVTGRRRLVAPFRLPGKAFAGYREGGHLAPEHSTQGRTFANYLATHPDPTGLSYRPRPR